MSPLPSVASTPRPGPTRVPSPTKKVTQGRKRAPSPRKTAAAAATTRKQPSTSTDDELQDMDAIVKEWELEDMVGVEKDVHVCLVVVMMGGCPW